jgi:hypothetical protein
MYLDGYGVVQLVRGPPGRTATLRLQSVKVNFYD